MDALHISHIQVNQAQKQRRRTYRAHGRINRECLSVAILIILFSSSFFEICSGDIFIRLAQLTCHPHAILS